MSRPSTPHAAPLPPLLYWTTQFNVLTTMNPGDTISYVIELQLPLSAGTVDQNRAALVDFTWRARG